ncbi:MAG: ATP-binding protein [Candidatus Zixiibacteriota bacterium]
MRISRLSSFLAPIRLRYLLIVTFILGCIFFSIAYLGIKKARQSLLNIMVDEGKALARSLILSSGNAIQSGLLLESLSEEKLADIAETARSKITGRANSETIRQFCIDYDLESLDILDSSLAVMGSNRWAIGFVPEYPEDIGAAIIEMMSQGIGYRAILSYSDDSLPVVTQYFLYEFPPGEELIDGAQVLVLAADAGYLDQIMKQIGIGYLIQEISGQSGIEYIFLQSRDGIIFSSKGLPPVLKIDGDPFLSDLMNVDSIGWRIHEFDNQEILEIASRFESVSYPPGVYRLGLNLDEFNEVSAGYDRQIITIAVILFLLTLSVVAVVSINQNYFILDKSFKQMRSMSDTIFDRITSAIFAYDNAGVIVAMNAAFSRLTGVPTDAIGKTIDKIKPSLPFDIPKPEHQGDTAISFEKEITLGDGTIRTVLLGSSHLPNEAGGGCVVLVYDITRRKQLERENRRRERLSEMGDMAAGVAHEIRNPLNAIGIAAQRLQMEFAPTEDTDEYKVLTGNILAETARLNQILTRFLDLAKTRASESQPINLADAIHRAVATLKDEAAASKIAIDATIPETIRVKGNVDKYVQVFINLIKNAMQAIKHDGTITIDADIQENERAIVTVTDTGPGFPDDVKSKIFQPYFTTKADGSGLGLALAYKTITDFGGTIEADNHPDGGARLKITIAVQ